MANTLNKFKLKLSELLADFFLKEKLILEHDPDILGLSSDSRILQKGELFIAYLGDKKSWVQYIDHAIKQGASAILFDNENVPETVKLKIVGNHKIPIIGIPHLAKQVGNISAKFYNNPSKDLTVVGITGTNGKTSTSQFIARALSQTSYRCGIIGTLGYGFPDQLQPGIFTTPETVLLQKELADLKSQGATAIAMEVSSHGLAQNRIAGVNIGVGVFTNLTRDHLDYHGDMENYASAKRSLFYLPTIKYAVINADDEFGLKLIEELKDKLKIYAYTQKDIELTVPIIKASDIKLNAQGISAKITTPHEKGVLRSHLLGRFNLSNLLATLGVLSILNISLEQALSVLYTLPTVPGRMQTFGGGKLPLVVVDYSHTPDALEQTLTALREHCTGKLWCVFGCGGNRDTGKRPMMAQIAERYSDQIIITDDNPRHENPEKITDEIVAGLVCPWAVEVEHNRQAAIAHAIDCAQSNDIILIAGKGHETYQQLGDEKLPFCDAEQVQIQLKLRENMHKALD